MVMQWLIAMVIASKTHVWVRETNTHAETHGKNEKPTINPGSQL